MAVFSTKDITFVLKKSPETGMARYIPMTDITPGQADFANEDVDYILGRTETEERRLTDADFVAVG